LRAVPIEKKRSRPANLRKPQLRELQRAFKILLLLLVISGKLSASVRPIALVFHQFVPQSRSLVVFAAPLRQQRQLAPRLPGVFPG